jgi:hypothetical protein
VFRALPNGGVGPWGVKTLGLLTPFNFQNKRRTFWYTEREVVRIATPLLHLNLGRGLFNALDNGVSKLFSSIIEPAGMVVGTRGVGWQWTADETTTPPATLADGGLIANMGLGVPAPFLYATVNMSEFTPTSATSTTAVAK